MISETITIPKTISEGEDRFVVKLKENLLRMIKEINRNSKKISEITGEEHEDPDYTDEFNSKANVDASNIGYGELFIEGKDDEGQVIYDAEDNREDWGVALTNDKNTIAGDNLTLVSSQNVYNETHPYMEKDGDDQWINPYHYINYKNLVRHEGAEDINKQDRWSEQDFFQPHEPNDNTVKENLIALDTALYDVAQQLEDKANINLNNLNFDGLSLINGIAMGSVYVQQDPTKQDPLIKVKTERVQDQQTGLFTDVYTVYTDYDPDEGGGTSVAIYSSDNTASIRKVWDYPDYFFDVKVNIDGHTLSDNHGQNHTIYVVGGEIKQDEDRAITGNTLLEELSLDVNPGHFIYDYDPNPENIRYTTGMKLSELDEVLYTVKTKCEELEERIEALEQRNS